MTGSILATTWLAASLLAGPLHRDALDRPQGEAAPEQIFEAPAETTGSIWDVLDANAKESKTFGPRFARFEYALDDRGFNVLHFMGGSELPHGLNIWGFIDIEGTDASGTNREDLSRFFLEIDIKKKLLREFGVIGEVNDLGGDGNTVSRLGFFYLPQRQLLKDWELFFFIKYFPYESDGRGSQFSFSWNKKLSGVLDGRLSAGGFFDLNFKGVGDDEIIVQEQQIRFRLWDNLHLMTEFRQNDFLSEEFGVATGLQYRF